MTYLSLAVGLAVQAQLKIWPQQGILLPCSIAQDGSSHAAVQYHPS